MELYTTRIQHKGILLSEEDINKNPFELFEKWYLEAIESGIIEPNAMNLSTVSKDKPTSRIVLLKKFNYSGFTFFTNYDSKKGKEIKNNPNACLLFYWDKLFRQIRIEGKIIKISKEESNSYFLERPYLSKVSAIISKQSKKIESRNELEKKINSFLEKNTDNLERPKNWGGYILIPKYFEFWQGQENRLHDRIVYKKKSKKWNIFRISP